MVRQGPSHFSKVSSHVSTVSTSALAFLRERVPVIRLPSRVPEKVDAPAFIVMVLPDCVQVPVNVDPSSAVPITATPPLLNSMKNLVPPRITPSLPVPFFPARSDFSSGGLYGFAS